MSAANHNSRRPWAWVPTLYFAEGSGSLKKTDLAGSVVTLAPAQFQSGVSPQGAGINLARAGGSVFYPGQSAHSVAKVAE